MQAKLKTLRQLDIACRLRALHSSKAEQQQSQAKRALDTAKQALHSERDSYQSLILSAGQLRDSGVSLDPCLHEVRLLSQLQAHTQLQHSQGAYEQADEAYQQETRQLMQCKRREEVVVKAHAQQTQLLNQEHEHKEQLAISDAQQAWRHNHDGL